VTFNTALKACGNGGRLDQALRVYAAMLGRGVRPTVTTFALLLAAAAAADSAQTVRLVRGALPRCAQAGGLGGCVKRGRFVCGAWRCRCRAWVSKCAAAANRLGALLVCGRTAA